MLSAYTPVFQVCELHFKPDDIRWEMSHYDENTGRRITATNKKPYLREGAVPSLLPDCPSYLSSKKAHFRESPDSKKRKLEENAMIKALEQSGVDDLKHKESRTFHPIDELTQKLQFLDLNYWSVVKQQESLLLCRIIKVAVPKILLALEIERNCAVHLFFKDV